MTRENKLALIIGFSLILVVAILITDHLSPAQSAQFADLGYTAHDVSSLELRGTLPPGQANAANPNQQQNRALAANSDRSRVNSPTNSNTYPNRTQSNPRREPGRVLNLQPGQEVAQLERPPVEMGQPINQNQLQNNNQANFRLHVVQANESLYGITRKYYGDVTLAKALAKFNQGRVRPNLQLQKGVTLRIPERWVLTGGIAPPQSNSSTSQIQFTTYTIKSTDTLGEISMAQLGTSRRWREIYDLNRNLISDPDHLTPGDRIRIPSLRR